MKIQVFTTYENLSRQAAEQMFETIKVKTDAVFCIASGNSPLRTCQIFSEIVKKKNVDVSRIRFVGLDEWLGVPADDPGTGASFFLNNIAIPLAIHPNQYHVFNASANDLQSECDKMDAVIERFGGIDMMIVGIGINGHIGFNEPGISFDLESHVIELTPITTEVGQKYFKERRPLKMGITLGLSHLMKAKKVLLLADGDKKAAIVAKALHGPVSNEVPASIILNHFNSLVMLDNAAAANLKIPYERMDLR